VVTEYEEIGQSNDNAPACSSSIRPASPAIRAGLHSAVTVRDS